VTPAGKRKQRSTKRVFEARPPFFGGSPSVNLLLRNANQTSCIARTIKTLSAFLHAVEGPQAQLAQGARMIEQSATDILIRQLPACAGKVDCDDGS